MTSARASRWREAATFGGAGGVVVAYALDGGAYDVVVRSQFGLILWWAIFLAAVAGLLPRARPGAPVIVALAGLAGLACWTAVSLGWSESDGRTLVEVGRVLHHLALLALVVAFAGRERWVAAVGGATAGGTLVCLIALGSRLAPGTFGHDTVAGALATTRLSVPLDYWNAVGAFAALVAMLLVAWSAHARTLVVRCLALAAAPAVLAVLYLTYSRASILDLLVGVPVLVAFASRRWFTAASALVALVLAGGLALVVRAHPQIADGTGTSGRGVLVLAVVGAGLVAAGLVALLVRAGVDRVRMPRELARRTVIAAGVVVVAAIVLVAVVAGPKAWRDFKRPYTDTGPDPAARLGNLNGGRYDIWASELHTFSGSPLKGSGAGTFEFTWNRDGRTGEFLRDAHSLYVEALGELGLPGLLFVLVFAGGAIMIVVRARRYAVDDRAAGAAAGAAGALAGYLAAAGVDWMWESTAVTALVLIVVGAAGASTLRPGGPVGIPARAGMAVAALVAMAILLPPLVATSRLRDSWHAAQRGDVAAAVRDARRAADIAPWDAPARIQLALLAEQAGDLTAAREDLLAAARREPTNWQIPLLLSRVEAELGQPDAALRAYRRARLLRPMAAVFETGAKP